MCVYNYLKLNSMRRKKEAFVIVLKLPKPRQVTAETDWRLINEPVKTP